MSSPLLSAWTTTQSSTSGSSSPRFAIAAASSGGSTCTGTETTMLMTPPAKSTGAASVASAAAADHEGSPTTVMTIMDVPSSSETVVSDEDRDSRAQPGAIRSGVRDGFPPPERQDKGVRINGGCSNVVRHRPVRPQGMSTREPDAAAAVSPLLDLVKETSNNNDRGDETVAPLQPSESRNAHAITPVRPRALVQDHKDDPLLTTTSSTAAIQDNDGDNNNNDAVLAATEAGAGSGGGGGSVLRDSLRDIIHASHRELLAELDRYRKESVARARDAAVDVLKVEMDRLHATLRAEQEARREAEAALACSTSDRQQIETERDLLRIEIQDLREALEESNAKRSNLMAEKLLLRRQMAEDKKSNSKVRDGKNEKKNGTAALDKQRQQQQEQEQKAMEATLRAQLEEEYKRQREQSDREHEEAMRRQAADHAAELRRAEEQRERLRKETEVKLRAQLREEYRRERELSEREHEEAMRRLAARHAAESRRAAERARQQADAQCRDASHRLRARHQAEISSLRGEHRSEMSRSRHFF